MSVFAISTSTCLRRYVHAPSPASDHQTPPTSSTLTTPNSPPWVGSHYRRACLTLVRTYICMSVLSLAGLTKLPKTAQSPVKPRRDFAHRPFSQPSYENVVLQKRRNSGEDRQPFCAYVCRSFLCVYSGTSLMRALSAV